MGVPIIHQMQRLCLLTAFVSLCSTVIFTPVYARPGLAQKPTNLRRQLATANITSLYSLNIDGNALDQDMGVITSGVPIENLTLPSGGSSLLTPPPLDATLIKDGYGNLTT